jgi:murein DD-endopeptidase MepM/ murein hydrolase activator NlpD
VREQKTTEDAMSLQTPLAVMRIRQQLPNHTFGMVRTYPDGSPKPHQGWDLFAPIGTPVFAVTEAEVAAADAAGAGDYGNTIILAFLHAGQWYYAFYAHLSEVGVATGETVYRGQQIGKTGVSGNAATLAAAEHHLHFEIRTQFTVPTGLTGRVDPATLFGHELYSSAAHP